MAGYGKTGRGQAWRALPEEQRKLILRMVAAGVHPDVIGSEVGVSPSTVYSIMRPLGGVIRSEMWQPSESRLSLDERVEIRIGLELGRSYRAIGEAVGRCASTVCREVNANGGRHGYRPTAGHARARTQARREKPTKLACNEQLRGLVVDGLEKLWSPQQIARRLEAEFGDDHDMRVSHETIYKSLYVQGRGELRRELTRCLRSGRAKRIPQGRGERRGRIPDMVMISERPAEIEDRAVPGHWEGDLIVGKGNKSAIGTLVERSTRYVMLLHLADGPTAESVRNAMERKIQTLPDSLRRSVTWDQGKEMSQHARFTIDTGVQVYFCDPHSPWQRGSNENTNGLLRQYLPKGSDLTFYGPGMLDQIAAELNARPRKTLNWRTPAEALDALLSGQPGPPGVATTA